MFAQINIEQSNILRIENLEKEREELLKVKVVKESEVSVIEDNYRKTIKRLMYLEDDNIVKTMLREEKTQYDKVRDRLEKDLDKLSKEIISKGVAINNLKRLNSNSVLKSKMNEIRNDKTLVITMINEYVDNIVIYRMHPLWLLVIVSYKGGEEMWGTVKSARYKKDEMFFDEALCQYGIEFQAWLLNNTEHCFSYDRENKIITYNGKSLVYKEFEEGNRRDPVFPLALYTKYRILGKSHSILGPMKQDGQSVWVDLLVGDDTIRIFNNHLHSTAITVHDDKYLSEHQFLTDTAGGAKIKNIFRRFRDNSMLRAAQADTIARAIAATPGCKIVCGDFNDTPMSYTYRVMAQDLDDAFRASGKGYSYTFRGFMDVLRIDYVLYSEDLECLDYQVLYDVDLSDHYPVVVRLRPVKR